MLSACGYMLQLFNSFVWVSWDIPMGGDEFALFSNKELVSTIKASKSHMTNYYSPTVWSFQKLVSSCAGVTVPIIPQYQLSLAMHWGISGVLGRTRLAVPSGRIDGISNEWIGIAVPELSEQFPPHRWCT